MAKENFLISIKDSSNWLKRGNIKPRYAAAFCYIQDRNVFWGAASTCQHCSKAGKAVDHLAKRCDRMLGHDYTRRLNEVVRCLHLLLANTYGFKRSNKMRGHFVQEIMENELAEIKVDARIKTDIKISNNSRTYIFLIRKSRKSY